MSWLFDQLSGIARADAVDVVIAADVVDQIHVPRAIDLPRLLVRGAFTTGLSIQLLSSGCTSSTLPLLAEVELDLSMIDSRSAASKVRSMLNTHRKYSGAVVKVADMRASLQAFGRLPRPGRDDGEVCQTRRIFATDRAGDDAMLREVSAASGLAVAIGGLAPSASVHVEDLSGFVAILDALITLREQAIGIDAPTMADATRSPSGR